MKNAGESCTIGKIDRTWNLGVIVKCIQKESIYGKTANTSMKWHSDFSRIWSAIFMQRTNRQDPACWSYREAGTAWYRRQKDGLLRRNSTEKDTMRLY